MRIFAGIVTFEPDLGRLIENIDGISGQVDRVLVYDNGSKDVTSIRSICGRYSNVDLIANPENRGIGHALNSIARRAVEQSCTHLVTLDQDSVCPSGMVTELHRHALDGVGIVTPYIVDRNKMTVQEFRRLNAPGVERYVQAARRGAITSGSLVDLGVWQEVGGYDEQFFIDYVDYDFNQRVLMAGWTILRTNGAYLLHEVGDAKRTWLRVPRKGLSGDWRFERFYSFGHSAFRCYYKARNRVLFTRKYGRRLGLTHEGVWQIPQQVILTMLFESDRRAKLLAFARGFRDGLRSTVEGPCEVGARSGSVTPTGAE